MNLDRILELLAKQMGSEASASEQAELAELLKAHPNHREIVFILQSIQAKKLKQPAHNEELVVSDAWDKLEGRLDETSNGESTAESSGLIRTLKARKALRRAAVWIGVIGLSTIGYLELAKSRPAGTLATIPVLEAVATGKPRRVTLPDGSLVWINAGSKMRYSEDRTTNNVYLEGEAFFNVKHNSDRAFVVHAGGIAVKALGTEFNVQAYPGDGRIEATLLSGKVQVTMEAKPDQQIILAPNEKFTLNDKPQPAKDAVAASGMSYEVKPVKEMPALQEVGEVAWMQDRLAFEDEPFEEIAKKMERRYDVHLVFEDEALKKEILSGVFKNEDIGKALRLLQMITPFQYRIKGDSILLWTQNVTAN